MSGKKKYSNEFKLKLVQEYLKGDKGGFRQIAKEYGVSVESLLTGFKFIGDRIHYYSKTREKTFEFGYEESYGYLISSFVRDKDSLQAMVIIAEMVNYYRLQGKRLDQVMNEISLKHGYHSDRLYSIWV